MFDRPRSEWASVEATMATPASTAWRTSAPRQVESIGKAVRLERDTGLQSDLADRVEVERVGRPVVDDSSLGVAEAGGGRMPHRLQDPLGDPVAWLALARVQADLHPLELGEHLVGKVERAVREDVGLDPAQDPEGRELVVRRRDLLALAPHVVGVEAGHDADVARVVADRDVLVAEIAGRGPHLQHGRAPVRPRRVTVEVAADLGQLDEGWGVTRVGLLAKLGWEPGQAERPVDLALVGRGGERLESLDVGSGPRGSQQLRAEAGRLGHEQLDRDAFDRDADGAPLGALDERDHRRQSLERIDDGPRMVCRDDDGQLEALFREAPWVTGHRASQGARDLADQCLRAVEQHRAARPFAGPLQPGEQPFLGLRPDARHRSQASFTRGGAKLVGRSHPEDAGDLAHPVCAHPEQAPQRHELRLHRALELVELGDAPGLGKLPDTRTDPRPDAVELADTPIQRELCDRRPGLPHGLGGAAVGACGVVARAG